MLSRSLGHRAPLLWLILPLIGGLAFGRAMEWTALAWPLAIAFATGVLAFAGAAERPMAWAVSITSCLFFSGAAAYQLQRNRLPEWDKLPPREARLTLRVDRVFAGTDPKRASGLATVVSTDSHLRELSGQKLYFSLALQHAQNPPIRSAVVAVVGVLNTLPRNPSSDTFDGYLAGAGMNYRLTRGRITGELSSGHAYYRFCAAAAKRCHAVLGLGIDPAHARIAGLLRAMMLGQTKELSEEQKTLFMQSGTMHLFAISGLNIGVIAAAIQALLLLMRLSMWQRFLVGSALLWLFVDVTGAAPSAVRAFTMAVFVQLAFVVRRPGNVLAALVASAFLVLLLSPLQVFSASFLMSYSIVLALLLMGLPLGECWLEACQPWRNLPEATWTLLQRAIAAAWRGLVSSVAIGVATTLVSVLTGVQFFQLLTPGALVANLLLIPAAMVVTLGGFASLLFGLPGLNWVAHLCNHAAALVLWLIEALVRESVRVPGAFLPARFDENWIGNAALALLTVTFLLGYALRWKPRAGGWWLPFGVVTLTLALGVSYG